MYRRRGWHGRGGRIERFQVAALLLLLRERPAHGYDLLERLPSLLGDERVDVGNLYRVLRRLEEQGLVSSEWDESVPGPAKRTYELTDAGGEALERWAASLAETRTRIDRFLQRHRGEGGDHAMHHRRFHRRRPPLGARFYASENVLERLDDYQRDLEQELADVTELIKRLREERRSARRTADDLATPRGDHAVAWLREAALRAGRAARPTRVNERRRLLARASCPRSRAGRCATGPPRSGGSASSSRRGRR